MNTAIIILTALYSSIGLYMIYTNRRDHIKAKKRYDEQMALCDEIQRRCERNLELIHFALELRLKGDHRGANLIDEDIRSNIVKLDKLEENLNKICSYNN